MADNLKRITEIDRHIGSRVRIRRMSLGLSMEVVADKIGVTWQQFQKYEIAKNRIAASTLERIARALNVTAGYFYEGQAVAAIMPDAHPDIGADFFTDRRSFRLAKAFLEIGDDDMQNAIVQIAEAAAARKIAKLKAA